MFGCSAAAHAGHMQEETFEGVGGVELFVRIWRQPGKPRAAVAIVHGFKAHSGLYDWAAEQFNARGIAVYAMDLRGHGRSGGPRLFVEKMADYVADVHRFVALVHAREPKVPVFLLAHSAGGVISSMYALQYQHEIDGFICESFAYEVPAPDIALTLLKGISHIAPRAHVFDLKDQDFSRDPKFVERMKNDELIDHESYPAQTVAEFVRADAHLKRSFQSITLPVLILHGTADRVTVPRGSEHFHKRAGSKDKTLKLYDDHWHDLLNDVGREQVFEDIAGWIEQRLPMPGAAAAQR